MYKMPRLPKFHHTHATLTIHIQHQHSSLTFLCIFDIHITPFQHLIALIFLFKNSFSAVKVLFRLFRVIYFSFWNAHAWFTNTNKAANYLRIRQQICVWVIALKHICVCAIPASSINTLQLLPHYRNFTHLYAQSAKPEPQANCCNPA